MILWRSFIISLCLSLSACTSSMMIGRMELGKSYFVDGQFKPAFCTLLPVAAYGYPAAQYAVGYMYYYGYGVSRDSESGLFWMNRAAEQGYCPAMRALALIRRGAPWCETDSYICPEKVSTYHAYKDTDAHHPLVGRWVPSTPCTECPSHTPASVTLHHSASANKSSKIVSSYVVANSNRRAAQPLPRISQNNVDAYGLQLYGAFKLDHVKNLQNEMNLSQGTRIWHTKHQNKDWYILTYGSYGSIADAKLARDQLPTKAKDLEPWVRNLQGLEKV